MILRTELRRSVAPVAGIGLLVVSVGLLYGLSGPWGKKSSTAPWDEQWTGLAQWTRYLALFTLPLVVGAGAWLGIRDHRSRVRELFATTPKKPWRRALPAVGALALAFTSGHVALLVVGGVQVASTAAYFNLKWLPVAGVMVLALVGLALLGVGIGRLVPSLVTPPLLAVATLALQSTMVISGPKLLTPAFESVDISVFSSVAVPVTLTQALWFVGIGATGFGLFVASSVRTRVAALLPAALAAAVAVPYLSDVDSARVVDPAAQALVCDDNGPRVCVTRANADYLPTLVGPAREALALMGKLPSPPTSIVEMASQDDYVPPPRAGVVPVFFEMRNLTDPEEIKLAVLGGSYTPNCADLDDWDTVRRELLARIVVASWLTGELAPVPYSRMLFEDTRQELQQVWQALQALPEAEQVSRVAALRDAALDCRGEVRWS